MNNNEYALKIVWKFIHNVIKNNIESFVKTKDKEVFLSTHFWLETKTMFYERVLFMFKFIMIIK